MNIIAQLCGLTILIILLIFYCRQRHVGLYTEDVFFKTLVIATVSVLFDVLSVIMIDLDGMIPQVIVKLICKIYLMTVIWVAYESFSYVLTDVLSEGDYRDFVSKLMWIVHLESVIILCLPVEVHQKNFMTFSYGSAVMFTYIFSLVFVVCSVVSICWKNNKILPRRRKAVLIWIGFWFVAALVQFIRNDLLLVSFAFAVGMVTLYINLENPERNMDRHYDCFHNNAMNEYLDQCFSRKASFSVLMISMSWYQPTKMESEFIDQVLGDIVDYSKDMYGVKIFKNIGQELVLVFSRMEYMTRLYQEIMVNFPKMPKAIFMLIPEGEMLESTDELFHMFRHIKVLNNNCRMTKVCYATDEILDEFRSQSVIEKEIIEALEEDRVEAFFHPIYSVKDNKFISAEVLSRIRYKDGTYMYPGRYIEVAEENGLIVHLGRRMFEKACYHLVEDDLAGLGLKYLEVNLSVVQCEDVNLASDFIRIMKALGVDPKLINLEITETGSLDSKRNLLDNMNLLREYGVEFSLDDFGNGNSNLDYVIDMPVSIIKFDMNMTSNYFKNYKAKGVMQSAIKMAHDIGLKVVAEGVETEEQKLEMIKLDVDYIQGYYFSKPLAIGDYIEFMKKNNN